MQNMENVGCVKAPQNVLDHEYLVLSSDKFHADKDPP